MRLRRHNLYIGLGLLLPVAAAQAMPVNAPPAAAPPINALRPEQVVEVHSLFFTSDELQQIDRALAVYLHGTGGQADGIDKASQDFLNQLTHGDNGNSTPAAPTERFFTYPQFFLESLVYHTPQDWMVRINAQKFTSAAKTNGNLEVLAVNPDEVTVEWKPDNLNKVKETLEQMPGKQAEGIDMGRGLVTFTLRPNQTFSSYVLRVLEGKVKPVVIDTNPTADTVPAQTPAVNAAPNPADEEAAARAADEATRALLPKKAISSPFQKEKTP